MSLTASPTAFSDKNRITAIDSLRGFALAGVALVHMTEQYIAGPQPDGFMEGVNGLPDQILQGVITLFFTGKFFALFSILFGLSFSIQMASAERKGEKFGGRFIWRAALLFLIGYVHQLFYRGDILTIYAVLAPFIIPFYKIPKKWLLITAGIIFLGIPRFIVFALFGNEGVTGVHAMMDNNHELVKSYIETISTGSLGEVFFLNATYGMLTKIDFQVSFFGRFYYTFAYFLIGLWLGRIGIFKDIAAYAKQIKNVMLWSIGVLMISFVLTAVTFATAKQPIDFASWQFALGMNFLDWVNISMTAIILCGFLMLYQKQAWEKRLSYFAPYGRMALTNYVMQSVIGTFIYFGWGLGYLGQLRTLTCALIGILLIMAQTLFSKYWLKRFRYGPLEWLWRCGTYLRWQPFLKETRTSPARS
jgi:uncharacterized protein